MIDQYSRTKDSNIKKLVKIALLISLSAVGAHIKIQGSIAFDSLPGFFAALYMGPLVGGLIGLLGHLLSAITAGFPLTLPMHLFISLQMFFIVWIFGVLHKRINLTAAIIIGTLLNGPGAALLASGMAVILGLPFSGFTMFLFLWIPLTIASALNVLLASFIYRQLKGRRGA
ncbi:ECF transporter S component [Alkaliphilus peptidifermentans]|uniref:Alpha-ribazole transporter n=1 Tax=Alkaliphilus peptidifermentans DSM 18978 TaxID=1120976 RepID=A0A1G5AR60_9FIRM|nr:ECF transporter S component [Alkaliphilus peptidifermentans]SCX80351.1 alpha-ribazole transporter [Alkaliphilus peptidifermentans DSM 18978]